MQYPDAIKWLNEHGVKKTVTREDGSEVEEDFVIGDVSCYLRTPCVPDYCKRGRFALQVLSLVWIK